MENLNNTPMDELNEDLGNAQEKLKRFEDRFFPGNSFQKRTVPKK